MILKRKKTKKIHTKKLILNVCKKCGSDNVEGKFYVNLNTEEPDMTCWDLNDEDLYFCLNCSENVEIEEKEIIINVSEKKV